ncbi:hypothetical protein EB796_001148 [Bugula neritina]|uniref:Uncharacterized protein n=1 Tax=Bugula neritina TaxID=10212 RepID=A0A7J7KR23_BUGNE|nr:hypothetical protein EB796_001148 [Bugula neritina]
MDLPAYNSGQFQSKINLMQKKPGLHQKLRTHQGVCFQLFSRKWTGNRKYGSAWGVILYDNASAEYYLVTQQLSLPGKTSTSFTW